MNDLSRRVFEYAFSFCFPEKRHSIASGFCEGKAVYVPGDMLYAIKKRYGIFAAVYTDIVLFGWCFCVCFLADCFRLPGSVWPEIPAFISCVIAFGLCKDQVYRMLLKLGFLCVSFAGGFCWSLTAAILLIFEHTAFCGRSSGKEQ